MNQIFIKQIGQIVMKVENIKFKAKRLDNCLWVEGSLLLSEKGKAYIGTVFDSNEENGSPVCFHCKPVDPSTICQFTGLRDTNDVPIFEGDIINFGGEGEVVFKDGAFNVKFGKYTECLLCNLVKSGQPVTIVNNKFDRKEGEE